MKREEALKVAKPILFNTEMVKAISENRKTATRRIIKSNKADLDKCRFVEMSINPSELRVDRDGMEYPHDLKGLYATFEQSYGEYFPLVKAPYQVGDILYVMETWCIQYCWECEQNGYADECEIESANFDFNIAPFGEHGCYIHYAENDTYKPMHGWKPSIHMPKEAARIFLRVTDVRAERLQDISGQGLIDEGLFSLKELSVGMMRGKFSAFENLWNGTVKKSDIGKYGWAANPWVWVIEFERLEVETYGTKM